MLGLRQVVVPAAKPSYEAGLAVAGDVLESGATAAIAFDDVTAHGLLAGLAERGIAVPAAFSVIGCDDVLGAATYPPLTTVSNRSAEAGRAALSLLMEVLASRAAHAVRHVLDTHLVMRETTAAPPAATRAVRNRASTTHHSPDGSNILNPLYTASTIKKEPKAIAIAPPMPLPAWRPSCLAGSRVSWRRYSRDMSISSVVSCGISRGSAI